MRTDLPLREIIARYRAGETIVQIAARYGCGATTIWKRLKSAGVRTRCTAPMLSKMRAAKRRLDARTTP